MYPLAIKVTDIRPKDTPSDDEQDDREDVIEVSSGLDSSLDAEAIQRRPTRDRKQTQRLGFNEPDSTNIRTTQSYTLVTVPGPAGARNKVICYNCQKPGHYAKDCWGKRNRQRNDDDRRDSPPPRAMTGEAGALTGWTAGGVTTTSLPEIGTIDPHEDRGASPGGYRDPQQANSLKSNYVCLPKQKLIQLPQQPKCIMN